MIGKLRGKVDTIGEGFIILDVNGVGYEVQASAKALRNLSIGNEATLTIDTHVRDDAIRLYGFQSEVERNWFRTLQSVQGVGARVALGVLGVLTPADLSNAIALGQWQAVEQAPGVGKRLAQRITTELKDKAPTLSIAGMNTAGDGSGQAAPDISFNQPAAEAISALSNLGYNPAQASSAVAVAVQELGDGAGTAQLIKRSLKELAR